MVHSHGGSDADGGDDRVFKAVRRIEAIAGEIKSGKPLSPAKKAALKKQIMKKMKSASRKLRDLKKRAMTAGPAEQADLRKQILALKRKLGMQRRCCWFPRVDFLLSLPFCRAFVFSHSLCLPSV